MWHFGTCFNVQNGLWVVISEWSWYVITFVNGILFLACTGCLSVPVLNTSFSLFPRVWAHTLLCLYLGQMEDGAHLYEIPFHCLGNGISRLPKGLLERPAWTLLSDLVVWHAGSWCLANLWFWSKASVFPSFLWMTPLSSTWHLRLHSCMALTGSKHSRCYLEKLF